MSALDVDVDHDDIVIRGQPKSGRGWKRVKTTRFSDMTRVKSQKTSWARKMQLKEERRIALSLKQKLRDDVKAKKQAMRERREKNEKKRLENERRAEIVQPIRNVSTIKKMKKKALRMLEKR